MSMAHSVGISAGMRRTGAALKKRSKFGNTKVTRAGEVYHSKREADRHPQLRLLERVGRIRNLQRQVKYRLEVNGLLICTYTADYVYEELANDVWHQIVEDVKGYPNDRWAMKKKLMKACHGIVVRET